MSIETKGFIVFAVVISFIVGIICLFVGTKYGQKIGYKNGHNEARLTEICNCIVPGSTPSIQDYDIFSGAILCKKNNSVFIIRGSSGNYRIVSEVSN